MAPAQHQRHRHPGTGAVATFPSTAHSPPPPGHTHETSDRQRARMAHRLDAAKTRHRQLTINSTRQRHHKDGRPRQTSTRARVALHSRRQQRRPRRSNGSIVTEHRQPCLPRHMDLRHACRRRDLRCLQTAPATHRTTAIAERRFCYLHDHGTLSTTATGTLNEYGSA